MALNSAQNALLQTLANCGLAIPRNFYNKLPEEKINHKTGHPAHLLPVIFGRR